MFSFTVIKNPDQQSLVCRSLRQGAMTAQPNRESYPVSKRKAAKGMELDCRATAQYPSRKAGVTQKKVSAKKNLGPWLRSR